MSLPRFKGPLETLSGEELRPAATVNSLAHHPQGWAASLLHQRSDVPWGAVEKGRFQCCQNQASTPVIRCEAVI